MKKIFTVLVVLVALMGGSYALAGDKTSSTKTQTVASQDAGTNVKEIVRKRREAFIKDQGKEKLLWATQFVNEGNDAVMVIAENGKMGMMFLYREGAWHALPDIFQIEE